MAAIEQRLEVDGARPAAKPDVKDRAPENIARSIEQDVTVELKVKVPQDRNPQRAAER